MTRNVPAAALRRGVLSLGASLAMLSCLSASAAAAGSPAVVAPGRATATAAAGATGNATAGAQAARPAGLRFQVVEGAGGVPLNVVSAGDPTKPAILLVHGIGQSYLSWENQLRAPLSDEFHVVAFDLRGHGNSGKPWSKESYTDYRNWAGDVQAVMQALHLDHPVLVGWSYGTLVVADYLRAYGAGNLRGIVLTGAYGGFTPPPPPAPPEVAARMARMSEQFAGGNIEDNIVAAGAFSRILSGHELPAAYYERATRISLMLPSYARRWMFQRPLANAELLPKITVPLLVTVGGKDSSTPEKDARDLIARVPGARMSLYPESGHSPFVEEAERYTRELAEFARPKRPLVRLRQGALQGIENGGVQNFRGIPYAGAPVGEWRWRAPRPAPSWQGVRDASDFGPVCAQVLRPGYTQEPLGGYPMSEDCLHLSVWTPQPRGGAKLPVMVWLLPGGFRSGDVRMSNYDGAALARRGVVVVTFNYRLGIFGEFAHPALSRAQSREPLGNYNLMDQIAALRWVRANIAAFGGDPRNVTIFGMSAGGVSSNLLMASPAAAGLFAKAISESSGMRMSSDRQLRGDQPGLPSLETEGERHVRDLGVAATDDVAVLRGLRSLSMQQLLDYQRNHLVGSPGGLTPVIDGRILREPTGKAFAAGRVSKVPYLTGGTDWEGSLVRMPGALGPVLEVVNATRAEADAAYHERDEQALAVALYSDFFFSSQRWLARQHARNGHPTYAYRFARVLEQHRGELPGAAHGAEARYVFGTLDTLHDIAGPDRPGDMGWRVTDADRAYADLVARYWVQFARTGNPNGEGLPAWPAVGRSDDAVLEFGQQQPAPWKDPHPERWAFFSHHFDSGRL